MSYLDDIFGPPSPGQAAALEATLWKEQQAARRARAARADPAPPRASPPRARRPQRSPPARPEQDLGPALRRPTKQRSLTRPSTRPQHTQQAATGVAPPSTRSGGRLAGSHDSEGRELIERARAMAAAADNLAAAMAGSIANIGHPAPPLPDRGGLANTALFETQRHEDATGIGNGGGCGSGSAEGAGGCRHGSQEC